ncbi:MAG: hypothetical protein GYB65_07585 [Chloroflexi bacterium]|nr:hypothetical protein [Chloroflexota bacterium]
MVSNGNHPLAPHYDDLTLEEFVLGQLLPDEEQAIRQHLAVCPSCRSTVTTIQALCRDVQSALYQTLDNAQPGPNLSFDTISTQWRTPPRRVTWLYRLQQQVVLSASTTLLIVLFVLAFLLLVPSDHPTMLGNLEIIEEYSGPPAVIAANTDQGLVVVQLRTNDTQVVKQFDHITQPRDMAFSPDGHWLALQQSYTLHIIETVDAGISVRIPIREGAAWAWSPDSQSLAYTDGTGQLAVFDVTAQVNRTMVPAAENAWGLPVWTADSSQLAYAASFPLPTETGVRVRQSLWRVSLSSGYRVELARNPAPAETLLVPTAWIDDDAALVAWDMAAVATGRFPTLYQVDVAAHQVAELLAQSLTQGVRLAWPVSAQDTAMALCDGQLTLLNMQDDTRQPITVQIPLPFTLAWSPNGAWAAYIVPSQIEGGGLYAYAPQDSTLRAVQLPAGATEKAVYWADAEHVFVVRQAVDKPVTELWLASVTADEPPQRIISDVVIPSSDAYSGWRWQDVMATQVLAF